MSTDICVKCGNTLLSVYCGQCYDRILDRTKEEEMALRQKLSRMEDALKTVNFWLDEFAVHGDATPDAIAHASRMQGDVLRKHLGEARRHAEEQKNKADRLQAEVEELREWQLKVAEGTGYINRAEGQGGYEVAAPETIIAAWKRLENGY